MTTDAETQVTLDLQRRLEGFRALLAATQDTAEIRALSHLIKEAQEKLGGFERKVRLPGEK